MDFKTKMAVRAIEDTLETVIADYDYFGHVEDLALVTEAHLRYLGLRDNDPEAAIRYAEQFFVEHLGY